MLFALEVGLESTALDFLTSLDISLPLELSLLHLKP